MNLCCIFVAYSDAFAIANAASYVVAYAVAYHNQNSQPLKTKSLFSLVFFRI